MIFVSPVESLKLSPTSANPVWLTTIGSEDSDDKGSIIPAGLISSTVTNSESSDGIIGPSLGSLSPLVDIPDPSSCSGTLSLETEGLTSEREIAVAGLISSEGAGE